MKISIQGAKILKIVEPIRPQGGVEYYITFTPTLTVSEEVMSRLQGIEPTVRVVARADEGFKLGTMYTLFSESSPLKEIAKLGDPGYQPGLPFIFHGIAQAGVRSLVFRKLPANVPYTLLIKEEG